MGDNFWDDSNILTFKLTTCYVAEFLSGPDRYRSVARRLGSPGGRRLCPSVRAEMPLLDLVGTEGAVLHRLRHGQAQDSTYVRY